MSPRRHIVVITRWAERYAEYERYIDHDAQPVSYVTTQVGTGSVPPGAADVRIIDATDDLPAVRQAVAELVARFGPPTGVVAPKEDDLLVGAALRAEWGCPGPSTAGLLPFRDKYLMCRAIADARLEIEPFARAPNRAAVLAFGAEHGWPVVVKPCLGSSSNGVSRVAGPDEVAGTQLPSDALVQTYNDDPVYHVDGVYDHGLTRWRAARYLGTCLDFRHGTVLGSVEEDDPRLNAAIGAAADRYLAALGTAATVVHLEMFVDRERRRCVFLEAGARAGGGETPFLWREVHGYDLVEQAFRIQLGLPPTRGTPDGDDEVCGHLLIPTPVARPCRVTHVTSLLGMHPGPYAETLPRTGDVLPDADSYYEHVGGRFRFRGPTSKAVEESILATADRFSIAAEPIEAADDVQTS